MFYGLRDLNFYAIARDLKYHSKATLSFAERIKSSARIINVEVKMYELLRQSHDVKYHDTNRHSIDP